ncbi:MAG: putative toxin-antitoxin system toxin component, PIN family [Phycisphaeraceae bacterium]
MKVFFDTNVYIAEALLGEGAARIIHATKRARWRSYTSRYVLDEVARVLVDALGVSRAFAQATRDRIRRHCAIVKDVPSRHEVPEDPKDSAILAAAVTAGVNWLVTNDRHLLSLDPYESVRIVSMDGFTTILQDHGLLPND